MSGAGGAADPGGGPGFRWDVALSFASAQRGYVEQVAEALKARGVRCFYDADEQIGLWGKYLAEELPAIYGEQAAVVVVFVSAEYADRDWTRLERRAVLSRAVRERQEYVLPARFDDTPLPGLLSDMVSVDLRRWTPQQFAAMIAEKLAALSAGDAGRAAGAARAGEVDPQRLQSRRRASDGPMFGWRDGGPEAWRQAQPRRTSVAPPWGLLPIRVRGRDELIEKLGELAISHDGCIHVLSGLGGNGKTTVALAVADRARGTGRAWWISARDRPSLDSGLLDLASALGITGEQLEQARIGVRSLLDLIWEQLNAAAQTWVLVVDNADSPELLATDDGETRDGNGVVRGSTRGLTLVTSRNGNQEVWGPRAVIHIVDPLDIQDGADVLLDLCGESAGGKQDAVTLARRLGGLPLALRAAGRYLSSTGARLDGVRTFTAYRRDLDTRFAVLQGPLLTESDPRDIVLTTWEASLDLLAERGLPQARIFMRMVGQFAPAPIPVAILDPTTLSRSGLLACREGQEFGQAELRQVVTALCDLGLLDLTDYVPTPRAGNKEPLSDGISCLVAHPLVVEVNATTLKEEPAMQEAATTTIVDLVSTAAGHGDPRSPSDAATWPLLAPHIELLTASVPRLPRDVVVRFAEAANRTATGLRHGGDYAGGYHLLVRALEAARDLGPEHPAVLGLRHSYAYVIDDMGRFSEAEDEYRSILAARTRSLGAQDLLTLSTRNHLAFSLSRQDKLREAEAEYRQVLEARQRLLGPNNQDTLTTQNLLGDVLHGQKRYTEAETQYETVLEAQLRLLGRDHPRTLITRNSLARNRSSLGRYAEAQEELRTILALRRSTRGAEHPSTLTTWHDLAVTLAAQGHSGKARQEFRGALEARRRVLGETHPDTLATAEALRKVNPRRNSEPLPPDRN